MYSNPYKTVRPLLRFMQLIGVFPVCIPGFTVTLSFIVYCTLWYTSVLVCLIFLLTSMKLQEKKSFDAIILSFSPLISVAILPVLPLTGWKVGFGLSKLQNCWSQCDAMYRSITSLHLQLKLTIPIVKYCFLYPVICTCATVWWELWNLQNYTFSYAVLVTYGMLVSSGLESLWILQLEAVRQVNVALRGCLYIMHQNVSEFRHLYESSTCHLDEVCSVMSTTIGLSILLISVKVTLTCYAFYITMNNATLLTVTETSIIVAVLLTRLYILVSSAGNAIDPDIASSVHNLLASMKYGKQKELAQIFLHSLKIRSSAPTLGEFVTLDKNLLVQIFLSAITYLLILAQFGDAVE